MSPKELVAQFIEEKLEGDISRLASFPLGNLRNDNTFGCPGRNFDSDDTELMRAIYCLVFGGRPGRTFRWTILATANFVATRSTPITPYSLSLGMRSLLPFGIQTTNCCLR